MPAASEPSGVCRCAPGCLLSRGPIIFKTAIPVTASYPHTLSTPAARSTAPGIITALARRQSGKTPYGQTAIRQFVEVANQGGITVSNIGFSAPVAAFASGLTRLVMPVRQPIFRPASKRTPIAIRQTVRDGATQAGAINTAPVAISCGN